MFNQTYFDFSNHPDTVYPLNILSCWKRLIQEIGYTINSTILSSSSSTLDSLSSELEIFFWYLALALSTDDTIAIVTYVIIKAYSCKDCFISREHVMSLPVHLVLVDAFSPCDLSTSSLGYVYGVIDTAVMWILDYGSRHLRWWDVCLSIFWDKRYRIGHPNRQPISLIISHCTPRWCLTLLRLRRFFQTVQFVVFVFIE